MGQPITTFGRVCLCEWDAPIAATEVSSLLARVKDLHASNVDDSILILVMSSTSAASIMRHTSSFVDVMPALWAYCSEVLLVCPDATLLAQLRRHLCGSARTPVVSLAHPLSFFDTLDVALTHVEGVVPHDTIELRRHRLRSGQWELVGSKEMKCR
ncbi:MAG: hypothetical protein QM784_30215 [Polyangiaceae bacterium]